MRAPRTKKPLYAYQEDVRATSHAIDAIIRTGRHVKMSNTCLVYMYTRKGEEKGQGVGTARAEGEALSRARRRFLRAGAKPERGAGGRAPAAAD